MVGLETERLYIQSLFKMKNVMYFKRNVTKYIICYKVILITYTQ